MACLFALTILIVALLTVIAPNQLMLLPQERRETERLSEAAALMAELVSKVDRGPSEINSFLDKTLSLLVSEPETSKREVMHRD